jgi:cellulose biosynthesis protein BcsQ
MIISFMNQKGGVGKTSVTLAVALTLEKAGERVGIIDMDSQKTSTRFLYYLRANNQTNIEITTSSKGFDYVLIDTAPSLSTNHVKAADISDRVIMVTKTAPPNLLSTQETIEYLRKHCRADLPLFLLFNHVDTRDGNTPNLKEKAVKVGGTSLPHHLSYMSDYEYIFLQGYAALGNAARLELSQVVYDIVSSPAAKD